MSGAVDLRRGRRKKVTVVFVSDEWPTVRFRLRVGDLTVAKAIRLIRADEQMPYPRAPFMVRIRGEGKPENKYHEVSKDSRLVLTEEHILMVEG